MKNIESYKNVAKDFKGKVLFVTINTDEDDHEKIMEFFGLKKGEVPAMRLIKLEEEMTKFKPAKNEFAEDAVRAFVTGVLEGTIKVWWIVCLQLKHTTTNLLLICSNICFRKISPKTGTRPQSRFWLAPTLTRSL